MPTGSHAGEDVSYSDCEAPLRDSAPPNFPDALHDALLPLVSVLPPTSGFWNAAELSKDQYPTRPFAVVPDGGAASATEAAHTGTTNAATVTNRAIVWLRLGTRTVYDCHGFRGNK